MNASAEKYAAMRKELGNELCVCGCGGQPKLAPRSSERSGHVKGVPLFFVRGHISRIRYQRPGGFLKADPAYSPYNRARQRCTNPNVREYHRYGGRGIKFLFSSFDDFIKCIGPRPSMNHGIDRIDTNGHYEQGNIRWATQAQQVRNSSKAKLSPSDVNEIHMLILAGFTARRIASNYGVHYETIYRIRQGRSWA